MSIAEHSGGDVHVAIVMATYNAGIWLRIQIESILAQSHKNWSLYISDDQSDDSTINVAQEYAALDQRVKILPPRNEKSSHVDNFEYLLNQISSIDVEAIFFSDQDDFWHPNKLELQIRALKQAPENLGAHFTDMRLVNFEGSAYGTFLQSVRLYPPFDLATLIAQNPVAGCSLAIRPQLCALALPFPRGLLNHDWWLAVCAQASANLGYDSQMLVDYRQHHGNVIGAFQPRQQVFQIHTILSRQARNVRGKMVAIEILISRLRRAGKEVPEELLSYVVEFKDVGRLRTALGLLFGSYAPRSKRLALVQAISVLVTPGARPERP